MGEAPQLPTAEEMASLLDKVALEGGSAAISRRPTEQQWAGGRHRARCVPCLPHLGQFGFRHGAGTQYGVVVRDRPRPPRDTGAGEASGSAVDIAAYSHRSRSTSHIVSAASPFVLYAGQLAASSPQECFPCRPLCAMANVVVGVCQDQAQRSTATIPETARRGSGWQECAGAPRIQLPPPLLADWDSSCRQTSTGLAFLAVRSQEPLLWLRQCG